MTIDEHPRAERLGEQGAKYRQALIENMAKVYGNRPSDAQPLSNDEELRLWMLPTSPAAVEAFKRGATLEEAAEANRLWAEGMKAQQQRLRLQGVPDKEIHAQGWSDEAIFKTTRAHAYERGKANAKDDPATEADYHQKMAQRAAQKRAQQMSYQTVGEGGADGSTDWPTY
jgi:hypothetical protein